MKIASLILVATVLAVAVQAQDAGLLIEDPKAETETLDSLNGDVAFVPPAALYASADNSTYYMSADIGAAFDVKDYRSDSKVMAVVKAPFVAGWQVVKAVARIPGAAIENAKRDPLEAVAQVVAVVAVVGSQTEWYGLGGNDNEKDLKGFKNPPPDALQRPGPEIKSYQQIRATRSSFEWVGSSSAKPKVDVTFGASGSAHYVFDPNEPEK